VPASARADAADTSGISVTSRPPALITERKEPVPLCDHDHGHGGRPRDVGDGTRDGGGRGGHQVPCVRRHAGRRRRHQVVWSDAMRPSRSASRARAPSRRRRGACTHAARKASEDRRHAAMQASSFEMLAAAGWHDPMEWNRSSFVSSCDNTVGNGKKTSFWYGPGAKDRG